MLPVLEMALEMAARGFSLKPIDLYRSEATKFIVDGNALIPPFSALAGIGDNAARNIAAARDHGEFLSIEDFQQKSKASKTIVELLSGMGCFRGCRKAINYPCFNGSLTRQKRLSEGCVIFLH